MTTRILYDDFGYFRGQEHQMDVKPDVLSFESSGVQG